MYRSRRLDAERGGPWYDFQHFRVGEPVIQFDDREERHVVLADDSPDAATTRHASTSCEPCMRSLTTIRAEHRMINQWEGWRWRFDQDDEYRRLHRRIKPRWRDPGHFSHGDRVTYNWPGLAIEVQLPVSLEGQFIPPELAGGLDDENLRHVGDLCEPCAASVQVLEERRRLRAGMCSTITGLEAELADLLDC